MTEAYAASRKWIVAALTVLSLAACGGGSGGNVSLIPEAKADSGDTNIEVEHLHCIVRPDEFGHWYVQNDADHSASGCALQVEQGPDYLRVLFARSYTHAGTVQVTSDDDFNVIIQGFSNLGLSSATIRVYAHGRMINPSDVYRYIPPGAGNFWVDVTMVNRLQTTVPSALSR